MSSAASVHSGQCVNALADGQVEPGPLVRHWREFDRSPQPLCDHSRLHLVRLGSRSQTPHPVAANQSIQPLKGRRQQLRSRVAEQGAQRWGDRQQLLTLGIP
jgi:hypothetical protein